MLTTGSSGPLLYIMTNRLKVLLRSNYKLDYATYFPDSGLSYGNVDFTLDANEDVDAVVICNHPTRPEDVCVAPENIFHVHQEPGDALYHGFMYNNVVGKKHSHLDIADITGHPCLNWLVNKSYDQLQQLDTSFSTVQADKNKLFSGVISGHNALNGHYFRLKILEEIKQKFELDLYGKGHNFIPDKWDALYPYKFSLAMENSSQKNYWTEKIMDCYLACTMPVYFGCPNIGQFFPPNSFITIDVDNLSYSLDEMAEKLTHEYYEANYQSILEARDLCLYKYSTAPGLSNIIETNYTEGLKKPTQLQPFKRSVFTDLKRKLTRNRIAHWIKDIDHKH